MAAGSSIIAGSLAAGGLASGIGGAISSNSASKRAGRQAQAAAQRFYDFEDPNYRNMELQLQLLSQQGLLDPALEQAILQGDTALSDLEMDPRLLQAELDALDTLQKISSDGGMDAQAMLAMEQARSAAQQQARGSREANLMDAAQRGASGSGLEFVSNQLADQNAANQGLMAGLQSAAAANQRELEALNQMSGLAGTMQGRGLNLGMAKGSAQDAINQFNVGTRMGAQQRNVNAQNVAQAQNLAERQRVADQNVGLRNQQQMYNKSLDQQRFDNNMARAQGAAGIQAQQAAATQQAGQQAASMWGGLGQAGLGAAANIFANKK